MKNVIESTNYAGQRCVLVGKSGRPLKVGSRVRGMVVTGGSAPHKPDSSGRVYVKGDREYFPGVVGAEWVCRPRREDT